MAEALLTNKICIDSRFRAKSSASATDFSIELPESFTLPPGTVCMVSDVCIPKAWYTVEANINDSLYLRYDVGGVFTDYVLSLPEGNYNLETLTEALADQLADVPLSEALVTNDATKGKIKIATGSAIGTLYILPDSALQSMAHFNSWRGPWYDPQNLHSINEILSNATLVGYDMQNTFLSGFVDTLVHHTIYIKCAQLGTFQNIAPQGKEDM
jgi:hypothetical protein